MEERQWCLTVPHGHSGVTVSSAHSSHHLCPALLSLKHCGEKSHRPYNLLGRSGSKACLLQILATVWSHLCVHYHCQNWYIFVAGQGDPALVLLRWGGVVFSKSYLLCSSSRSVSCLPSAAQPPLLPQPPHPEFWKAHL